jgi:hypothetical protein
MKPYGLKRGEDHTERGNGAQSKHRKMTGKNRKSCRRVLHKAARNAAKVDVRSIQGV